jgi:hypothetical protein
MADRIGAVTLWIGVVVLAGLGAFLLDGSIDPPAHRGYDLVYDAGYGYFFGPVLIGLAVMLIVGGWSVATRRGIRRS